MATAPSTAAALDTAAIATIRRLPSTRHLHHQRERSRGSPVHHLRPSTPSDQARTYDGFIFTRIPASTRSYAIRKVGDPSSTPTGNETTKLSAAATIDNAHRASGFGQSMSAHDQMKMRERVKQLESEAKEKDEELRKARQLREQHESTLSEQTARIETLDSNAHRAAEDHANELKSLRELSDRGLRENEPLLEALRLEGETRAQKRFDQQQQELNDKHEEETKAKLEARAADVRAQMQSQIDRLTKQWQTEQSRLEHERQALDNKWQKKYDALRLEHGRKSSEASSWMERASTEQLEKQKARAEINSLKSEIKQRFDARTLRAEIDRPDYSAYRELFDGMHNQLYDVLMYSRYKQEDLKREAHTWRSAEQSFNNDPKLGIFRHNARYAALKKNIIEFLRSRAKGADEAARALDSAGSDLRQLRKDSRLLFHTSRRATRRLQFDEEQTYNDLSADLVYTSGTNLWNNRMMKCMELNDEIKLQIQKTSDNEVRASLEKQKAEARRELDFCMKRRYHAIAFMKREEMHALLNAPPIDQVVFRRSHDVRREVDKILDMIDDEDSGNLAEDSKKRVREALADVHAFESMIRQRVVYEEELGLIKNAERDDARKFVERLYENAKLNELQAMQKIAGRSASAVELRRFSLTRASLRGVDEAAAKEIPVKLKQKQPASKPTKPGKQGRKLRSTPLLSDPQIKPNPIGVIARYRRDLRILRRDLRKQKAKGIDSTTIEKIIAARTVRITELQEESKATCSAPPSKLKDAESGKDSTGAADAKSFISRTKPAKLTNNTKEARHTTGSAKARGLNMKPSSPLQAWSYVLQLRNFASAGAARDSWKTLDAALQSNPISFKNGSSRNRQSASTGQHVLERRTFVESMEDSPGSAMTQPRSALRENNTSTSSQGSRISVSSSAPSSVTDTVDMDKFPATTAGVDLVTDAMLQDAQSTPEEGTAIAAEELTVLDYQIPKRAYRDALMASQSSNAAYWSHNLYKSQAGDSVKVFYCTSLEIAEERCKLFATEPVLGFDLEWEMFAKVDKTNIKRSVSLIQIAAEDKICLLHIAKFQGDTPEQLVPPSLKTILENANIVKAGVNVRGDAERLRECLDVDMKGVFELSHMYRLVKFGGTNPKQVNFKLVNLAAQVQDVLLLPLKKDEVRTSAWSARLNGQQSAYAAADAYAGFRLFYQLDNMRKEMVPTPPRPAFFETGRPIVLGNGQVVERSVNKARATTKRNATVEEEDEEDEFFDATEKLPPTYELEGEPGSAVVEEATAGVQRDQYASSGYPDLTSALAAAQIADEPAVQSEMSNDRPLEGALTSLQSIATGGDPRSPFVQADDWSAAYTVACEPSAPKVGHATLRAYHLWHHQKLSIQDVAAACRQPPLALTSVASYIMQAIKEEELEYEQSRLRNVLECLPDSVWKAYSRWIREAGMREEQ